MPNLISGRLLFESFTKDQIDFNACSNCKLLSARAIFQAKNFENIPSIYFLTTVDFIFIQLITVSSNNTLLYDDFHRKSLSSLLAKQVDSKKATSSFLLEEKLPLCVE
ncbi:unnamed protein product [Heterobilharzia americana]|nr:unnamed protein product [Heterobilharzia americana]